MILLYKGQQNDVYLTLNEKVTIDAPVYFLFRFINDETQVSKTCLSTDVTNRAIERYNQFVIEEGTPEAPLTGKLSLDKGQYSYEVYAQHSSTNLDYTLADELVEADRCMVMDETIVAPTDHSPEIEIRVYDPAS